MTKTSEIILKIDLDEKNIPEKIKWHTSDMPDEKWQECKSLMISIWDHAEQNTLRIDLWTKDLRLDEMDQHFFQTLITLAESYQRANGNKFIVEEMKSFCNQLSKMISEDEAKKSNSY